MIDSATMIIKSFTAMICLALLSGCIDLLPGGGPPAQIYNLTPKSSYNDALPSVNWQLV